MKRGRYKPVQRKKAAFLAAYAETGNISRAVAAARIPRQSHYDWLKTDEAYRRDFESANDEAIDTLEAEARRRAHDGVNEPVIYQGELMGMWVDGEGKTVSKDTPGAKQIPLTIRKYSDTLLIFLLKAARPAKYRDTSRVELSGSDNGPIHIEVTYNVRATGNGRLTHAEDAN